MEDQVLSFNTADIMECQQNRYPMLFLDQVTECVPLKYAKGYKLFSYDEWYFHGYESLNYKVWSSVQIEAMTQLFLMTFLTADENKGYVTASNKFENVQFIKDIKPGQKLNLEARLDSFRHGIARGIVYGEINGLKVCSLEATIVVPDIFYKIQKRLPVKTLSRKVDPSRSSPSKINFGIDKIRDHMLFKYPWLFLDNVSHIEPGKVVKANKLFTYNEKYFPSHFPSDPNVPGFIIIESCIQAFLLTFLSLNQHKKSETANRSLKNVQLKRKILPGDILELHARLDTFKEGVASGSVESFVNSEQAVSFEITTVLVD
jgi:3-hydroxyacyl-[acyl-carrier-protein] dehydratase